MSKYLDETGLSQLWKKIKQRFLDSTTKYASSPTVAGPADKALSIPFGVVDSTSTATAFTATVDGIPVYDTENPTTLADGTQVFIKNTKVTSAAASTDPKCWTLNVNGYGAKKVYVTTAAATYSTTQFTVNYKYLFIYDSSLDSNNGGWYIGQLFDSNTNTIEYQIRTNSTTRKTTDACRYYKVFFSSADGTMWVPAAASTTNSATSAKTVNQRPIDPFGPIVYYSTTTSFATNANVSASYIWQQYNLTLGYSFNRTGAALTLTTQEPVYIKCAPQADGSAIIDADNPFVQELPDEEDGKIYIFFGVASGATTVELNLAHPVYYVTGSTENNNRKVRIWTNPAVASAEVQKYNADRTDESEGTADYGQTDVVINGNTSTIVTTQAPPSAVRQYIAPSWRAMNQKLAEKADADAIPTKTSDLTNDNNFLVDHGDQYTGIIYGNGTSLEDTQIQDNAGASSYINLNPAGITVNTEGASTGDVTITTKSGGKLKVNNNEVLTSGQVGNGLSLTNGKLNVNQRDSLPTGGYDESLINIESDNTKTSYNIPAAILPWANTSRRGIIKVGDGLTTGNEATLKVDAGDGLAINQSTKELEVCAGDGLTINENDGSVEVDSAIISGASAGATAIQPTDIKDELDPGGNGEIPDSAAIAQYIEAHAPTKPSSSTDNAIARYDGTNGNLQNSGVTINDSNHVTAAKFITSGGTSSQFVKGDGSLDSNTYAIRNNAVCSLDYVLNTNVNNTETTKRGLYINHINDRLYSADKRFYVTHKVYNSTTNAFVKDLSTNIFCGNIEQHRNTIEDGQYAELYIGVEPEATLGTDNSMLWTYGSETLFLTFYTGRYPDTITEAKLYYKSGTPAWIDCTITKISDPVYKITLPNKSYPAAIKIKWSGTSDHLVSLSDVKAFGGRSTLNTESLVTKYPDKQDLWGDVEAPKFIKRGGTSSQFLKADGSVDSNTYLTGSSIVDSSSVFGEHNLAPSGYAVNAEFAKKSELNDKYEKPSGGIPKTDLASAVQTSLDKADTALQSHQDISGKVDKVDGKGLSTNDYTTAEKTKLGGISEGAEVNVQSNWNETNSSSDAYIQNKPTIPTALADLTEDSSHKVVSQTSITTWNDKAEKVTQVNHGTSDTTYTITPNVLHVWGEVTSLNLTLGTGESGVVNEYMFQFYSGNTPTTLTLPNSVIWVQPLTTQAGKTYQVSIVNNLACYITDGMAAAESSGGTPTYATQAWVTSLIDSVPTANSSNIPTSGGTYAMIEGGYYYS